MAETDKNTDGHRDLETELSQWADSVKISVTTLQKSNDDICRDDTLCAIKSDKYVLFSFFFFKILSVRDI